MRSSFGLGGASVSAVSPNRPLDADDNVPHHPNIEGKRVQPQQQQPVQPPLPPTRRRKQQQQRKEQRDNDLEKKKQKNTTKYVANDKRFPFTQRTLEQIRVGDGGMPRKEELYEAISDSTRMLDVLMLTQRLFARHLYLHPKLPLVQTEFNRSRAIAIWHADAHGQFWNNHSQNLNLSDHLFVTMCFDHVCRNRGNLYSGKTFVGKLQSSINIQTTLTAIQMLGASWRRSKNVLHPKTVSVLNGKWEQDVNTLEEATDMLFRECAGIIVFGYCELGLDAMMDIAGKRFEFHKNPYRKALASYSDEKYSTEVAQASEVGNSTFTSQGQTGLAEYERIAAIKRKEKDALRVCLMELVHSFIPWATRVFMSIMFDRMCVYDRFNSLRSDETRQQVQADYKRWGWDHSAVRETLRSRFDAWMTRQTTRDPSSHFTAPFTAFCYERMLPPGSSLAARRQPTDASAVRSPQDLFHSEIDDESECKGMQNSISTPLVEMWADATHVHRSTLAFFMFTHLYKHTVRTRVNGLVVNRDFVEDHCLMDHQPLSLYTNLGNNATTGLMKRPILVQSHGEFHVFYDNMMYIERDVVDTLLLWLLIMRHEFGSRLADGQNIECVECDFVSPIIGRSLIANTASEEEDDEDEEAVAEEENTGEQQQQQQQQQQEEEASVGDGDVEMQPVV